MSGIQVPQDEPRKPRRNATGQLLPGERLNGSGLERYKARMKNQLDQLTPKAIARLGKLVESDNEQVALGAANSILDRNLGKPKASLDMKIESSMSALHLQSLVELASRARERQAERMIDVTPDPAATPMLNMIEAISDDISRDD